MKFFVKIKIGTAKRKRIMDSEILEAIISNELLHKIVINVAKLVEKVITSTCNLKLLKCTIHFSIKLKKNILAVT